MAQPTTIAAWISCGATQGLPTKWGTDTKYPWAAVAARNIPASAPKGFALVCEANLRARGIIYYKNNCGDCPAVQKVTLSNSDLASLATKAGTTGLGVGLAAAGVTGVVAGAATLGLAAVGTVIATIFANHAQAVKNEQTTICQVSGLTNQIIAQIDAAVAQGKLTPAQGVTAMQGYTTQLISQLQGIEKTCDAACVYQAILRAHADMATTFYAGTAPVTAVKPPAAPAAPPTVTAPPASAPGTVTQSSGGSSQAPIVSSAPAQVAGVQSGTAEAYIYPLYGSTQGGTVYILYNGVLYPVNILTNSFITPGYIFEGGVLPPGYSWGNINWYPTPAQLPYPVATVAPKSAPGAVVSGGGTSVGPVTSSVASTSFTSSPWFIPVVGGVLATVLAALIIPHLKKAGA